MHGLAIRVFGLQLSGCKFNTQWFYYVLVQHSLFLIASVDLVGNTELDVLFKVPTLSRSM